MHSGVQRYVFTLSHTLASTLQLRKPNPASAKWVIHCSHFIPSNVLCLCVCKACKCVIKHQKQNSGVRTRKSFLNQDSSKSSHWVFSAACIWFSLHAKPKCHSFPNTFKQSRGRCSPSKIYSSGIIFYSTAVPCLLDTIEGSANVWTYRIFSKDRK